ncbi:MAG TPA: diaminopimelate epimerase [bacterium]|nr:diaminopimelate epimerase [bacterium]
MLSKNQFVRSHGLGNDYLVMDPATLSFQLTPANIIRICNRNTGVGSDGILALEKSPSCEAKLRIYNPDGSEAEKSGNGLRIFCKFLFEHGYTQKSFFEIETAGGTVQAQLHLVVGKAVAVTVDMGKAEFKASKIPVNVPNGDSEVLDRQLPLDNGGDGFKINCVSMGNPHCVIFMDDIEKADAGARQFGHLIETHPLFPKRTNVQFAVVNNRKEVSVRIWERGAGYTLASGSSSCAVAAVCVKTGKTDGDVTVHMPGGDLALKVSKDFDLTMRGPVEEICVGNVTGELLQYLEKNAPKGAK